MAPSRGTGFINPEDWLRANWGAGQQMAQGVADETARQGDAQRSALASLQAGQLAPIELVGQMQATGARANLAAPAGGGLASVMASDYGRSGPYTSGMSSFDAFLTGGAGGKTLVDSANKYGGLGKEADDFNLKALATPAAPPAPAASTPKAPAGPSFRPPMRPKVPAPFAPSTFNPEQTEDPRRKKNRQMDNSWVSRPWGGL